MKNKKIVSSFTLLIGLPFRFFKKSKIDNFVGGLIFGALFSMMVNIFTVKVQEDLTRQRALEALEREITFHILDANNLIQEEKQLHLKNNDQIDSYPIDDMMSIRLDNRIWESREVSRYLLEIEPQSAAEVEIYYRIIVDRLNRSLARNQSDFEKLYAPCRAFYTLQESKEMKSKEYCREISKNSLNLQAYTISGVVESNIKVKEIFHPTKDRLKSLWLKFLLGDKSVEILK